MKVMVLLGLTLILAGCVVYNDGENTGIITPVGATSTAQAE